MGTDGRRRVGAASEPARALENERADENERLSVSEKHIPVRRVRFSSRAWTQLCSRTILSILSYAFPVTNS